MNVHFFRFSFWFPIEKGVWTDITCNVGFMFAAPCRYQLFLILWTAKWSGIYLHKQNAIVNSLCFSIIALFCSLSTGHVRCELTIVMVLFSCITITVDCWTLSYGDGRSKYCTVEVSHNPNWLSIDYISIIFTVKFSFLFSLQFTYRVNDCHVSGEKNNHHCVRSVKKL